MTLADLRQALSAGSALVFLKELPQACDGHALLVEVIEDEWVAVRDPWPPGYGAAYWVKLESFLRCWLLPDAGHQSGRAVVIK